MRDVPVCSCSLAGIIIYLNNSLKLKMKAEVTDVSYWKVRDDVWNFSSFSFLLTNFFVHFQLTASEEEFLRTYAGVVNSQLSQLPQHSIDQGECWICLPCVYFICEKSFRKYEI